jgi:hypothetical protein
MAVFLRQGSEMVWGIYRSTGCCRGPSQQEGASFQEKVLNGFPLSPGQPGKVPSVVIPGRTPDRQNIVHHKDFFGQKQGQVKKQTGSSNHLRFQVKKQSPFTKSIAGIS